VGGEPCVHSCSTFPLWSRAGSVCHGTLCQRSAAHVTSVRSDERMDGISETQFRLMISFTNRRQTNARYGCMLGSQRIFREFARSLGVQAPRSPHVADNGYQRDRSTTQTSSPSEAWLLSKTSWEVRILSSASPSIAATS